MPIFTLARAIPIVRTNKIHPVFLFGEHVLDIRANLRFGGVGPAHRRGHGSSLWFLAMNAADEAVLFHERLIGRRGIGRVRHTPEAVLLLSSRPSRSRVPS